MASDHYQTLGVLRSAKSEDIRSAYRKIALAHHPDVSTSPDSEAIFLAASEAYAVLSDFDKRKHYDAMLVHHAKMEADRMYAQKAAERAGSYAQSKTAQPNARNTQQAQPVASITEEITKLSLIFSRGKLVEAETVAKRIVAKDPRQPIPYAVLGDISRSRGNLDEAAKMYAFAAQMDPRNTLYQQRHEEMLKTYQLKASPKDVKKQEDRSAVALVAGAVMVICCALYVMISREQPMMPSLKLISTWTLGLFVMLFLGGVSIGSTLSIGGILDKFQGVNTLGQVSSPMIALSSIAVVNFWAAVILFVGISLAQHGFNRSHAKFLGAVGAVTLVMTLASALSPSSFNPGQIALWGGNLSYIGALCGWMVADSFRRI